MHRQGYDLQLTQYDERGWRATFYTTGMEHSPMSATGTGADALARDSAAGMGRIKGSKRKANQDPKREEEGTAGPPVHRRARTRQRRITFLI